MLHRKKRKLLSPILYVVQKVYVCMGKLKKKKLLNGLFTLSHVKMVEGTTPKKIGNGEY